MAVRKAATRHVRNVSSLTRRYAAAAAAPPLPHRIPDFSAAQVVVLFLLLVVLASIPIWTAPLPPLSDYANHLARMHVIANGGADAKLAQFYRIDWQIVPNLMMDLLVPVFAKGMNVYLAGQIFTVLMFLVIVSGMFALNRALFGRWSVLPLVAIPLLYNHIYLVGLMNYLFGIGLAMWALASWIWLRQKPWPLRYAVSAAFVGATFFCHLFAVGLYGMGLLAYEAWRLWLRRAEPWPRLAAEFCATGLPFLVAVPLMMASPTLQLATEIYWESHGKLDGLIYVIQAYSDVVAFLIVGSLIAAASWAVPRRLMRLHPVGWPLLAVSVAVYLAMPRVLFASYIADQRLPIAIAFMMVATADLRLPRREVRRAFIALVLTLLVVRVIEVNVAWSDLSSTTKQFKASVKRIAPGSKVLVAYADGSNPDDVRELGLVHAACIAMIERSALVTTAFTVPGKQIMQVRDAYRAIVDTTDGTPPSISQLVLEAARPDQEAKDYWRGWAEKYDYLYVLFTPDDAANPDPAHLTLVQDNDRFQLYRIKR